MSVRCLSVTASYFLLVTVVFVDSFNLNWNYARMFSDGKDDSYFGFTVAFRQDGFEYKLLVGAPRGAPGPEDKEFKMQGIVEPGVVFQCSMNGRTDCGLLKLDTAGNIPQVIPNVRSRKTYVINKKDRGWFGGVMAVNDDGKRTVVCAPKWKNSRHEGHYLMNGICYMSDEPNYTPRTKFLMPLVDRDKQSYNHTSKNELIFNYAYGEAGFTAHFPEGSKDLIIGAPGVFDWKGTIIRYKEGSGLDLVLPPQVASALGTRDLFENNYLGYSLASGKFIKNDRKKLYYVSGAPRAAGYKGKVFVFDFQEYYDNKLDIKFTLDGTQMGEYFGGSLCVADLNGDQVDDLIVGAPQYSLKTQNAALSMGDEGRIYVFMVEENGNMYEVTEHTKIMGRRKHGARFGTAIANVGDLNYDGLQDIAVGAPYEGNGVVYIYHGRRTGSPSALELVQTIEASKISPVIKGLGISFSKGLDIDSNYYNDIAVGAFESGHAVLLRGHPIITFHASLTSPIKRITNKTKDFDVKACLSYSGAYAPDTVDSIMSLKVDSSTTYGRGTIDNSGLTAMNYTDTLRNASNACRNVNIKIKDDIKDPSKPIDVVMYFDLKNNPADQKPNPNPEGRDGFCKDCPVLDIFQSKTRIIKIPFETGCKTDVCKPDLKVDVKFTEVEDKLILGVQQTLEMIVDILNEGDPAFLPEVKIYLPNETPLVRYPQICQNAPSDDEKQQKHILKCLVGNSLAKNRTIKLQLDIKDVPVTEKQLVFEVNVTSSGEEATPEDNYKKVTLDLLVQSDMTITGVSSREQIVYVSQNDSILKDLHVNYTFEVWNIGPSKVDKAILIFEFPFMYSNESWQPILELFEPKSALIHIQNVLPIECRMEDKFSFAQKGDQNDSYVPIELGPIEPEESFPEHNQTNASARRSKRSSEFDGNKYVKITPQTPVNKTLFLNCASEKVQCATVTCEAGPFFANKSRAVITFPMNLKNLDHLEGELATKEMILYSARGQVTINYKPDGNRPDDVIVQTMYLGKVNIADGGVPSWIIAVAIICGLLIFCLIAMMLHKMGFFKRAKKDELEALKEAEAEADADD